MRYILFLCTENSARSQMAEGFFNFHNRNPEYKGISAGTKPAESVKPLAVEVMKEKGIDISNQKPKKLTFEMIERAERIVTMGCTEGCVAVSPEKTVDWKLEDPAGKSVEKFREVRDEIERRVRELVDELRV
ncbi:MAG: arsenate reductase ArsC [Candidatus Micrarchaeia archaeon]